MVKNPPRNLSPRDSGVDEIRGKVLPRSRVALKIMKSEGTLIL